MNDNLAGDGVRRPVFDPQTGEQLVRPTFERIVRIDPPRRPEPAAGPRALWKFWLASLTIFFWMIWLGVGQYIDDWRATAILAFVAFVFGIIGDAIVSSRRSFLLVPGCLFGPVLVPLALIAIIILIYFLTTGASDYDAAFWLLAVLGAGLLIMLPAMAGAFVGAILRRMFPDELPHRPVEF